MWPGQLVYHVQQQHVIGPAGRKAIDEYAGLFVALIGTALHPSSA